MSIRPRLAEILPVFVSPVVGLVFAALFFKSSFLVASSFLTTLAWLSFCKKRAGFKQTFLSSFALAACSFVVFLLVGLASQDFSGSIPAPSPSIFWNNLIVWAIVAVGGYVFGEGGIFLVLYTAQNAGGGMGLYKVFVAAPHILLELISFSIALAVGVAIRERILNNKKQEILGFAAASLVALAIAFLLEIVVFSR